MHPLPVVAVFPENTPHSFRICSNHQPYDIMNKNREIIIASAFLFASTAFMTIANAQEETPYMSTSSAFAVSDPCGPCNPCDPCGQHGFKVFRGGSRLKAGGWIEATYFGNEYGTSSYYDNGEIAGGNGDVFSNTLRSTDFNMNQLWIYVEREMDCTHGFDWGFRTDFHFGMGAPDSWKGHDQSFDYGWGTGDYGLAFTNIHWTLGYRKLSAKVGLFATPLGWEATESWDNFFTSGALVNSLMCTSHLGFLARYEAADWLTLSGGWTNGYDNGENRFGDSTFVGILEVRTSEKCKWTYNVLVGEMNDGMYSDGSWRYGLLNSKGGGQGYVHSLFHTWDLTGRLMWMCEWALSNWSFNNGGAREEWSAYGMNNHLIYTLNDRWSFGTRLEWCRDNSGLAFDASDYNELTLGLNWSPRENFRLRPELRYDWVCGGARPFKDGTEKTQLTGGFSMMYHF